MSHLNLNQLAWRTWRTFFFKQACLAGTFSQDHPALILNFKSLAFNPLSWPGTLHHLFWGFVITESTCRVLQHFKLSVDKNQNNYNFHKLKTAIQTLQPHLTPIFHNKSLQREGFSCTRAFCSFCHRTVGGRPERPRPPGVVSPQRPAPCRRPAPSPGRSASPRAARSSARWYHRWDNHRGRRRKWPLPAAKPLREVVTRRYGHTCPYLPLPRWQRFASQRHPHHVLRWV